MFELQKKQRESNRINSLYSKLIQKAKKEHKTENEIEGLISEMFSETGVIEEEIKYLLSRKWVQKAEKLFLPVPSYNELFWERGNYTRYRFLTPDGITKIRSLVRDEMSAQRKMISEWIIPTVGVIVLRVYLRLYCVNIHIVKPALAKG